MAHNINDFIFLPFQGLENTEEAKLTLKNGYTVRVLKGKFAAHTYGAPYELSISPIIKEITEDSIGYLSEEDLLKTVSEIESFPKLKSHK